MPTKKTQALSVECVCKMREYGEVGVKKVISRKCGLILRLQLGSGLVLGWGIELWLKFTCLSIVAPTRTHFTQPPNVKYHICYSYATQNKQEKLQNKLTLQGHI